MLVSGALDHGDMLETTADIIWAKDICYIKMEELDQAEFKHIVSTSLNIHLFEVNVPLSVHTIVGGTLHYFYG